MAAASTCSGRRIITAIGFIGCEPFLSGVAKLVRAVDEAGLGTVRLHDDDARHVLDWLPEASIGRVFVLFPDPWPKKAASQAALPE